jgi:hypothetical protein
MYRPPGFNSNVIAENENDRREVKRLLGPYEGTGQGPNYLPPAPSFPGFLPGGKLPLLGPKGFNRSPPSPSQSTISNRSPVQLSPLSSTNSGPSAFSIGSNNSANSLQSGTPAVQPLYPQTAPIQPSNKNRDNLLKLLTASQGVQRGATDTYKKLEQIGQTEGVNAPSWRWKFQSSDVTRSKMEGAIDGKINKLINEVYGPGVNLGRNVTRRKQARKLENPNWANLYPVDGNDYEDKLNKWSPVVSTSSEKPGERATGIGRMFGGSRKQRSKKSRRRVRKAVSQQTRRSK